MATANIGELVFNITGDGSGVNKELQKVDKQAGRTAGAFKKVGIAAAAAFAVKALANFGRELINVASDAEETANKFGVVFSDVSAEANEAARELAVGYGLSSKASKQLLSDTGDLLSGFGFAGSEALDLSVQVNKLAVDLASFTNYAGGAEGASAALTKALLGERESIKSLGISITEADIQQLAEDKGITGSLDRQTKAALTLELAMKQSKNAIGDFERSQLSFANQSRIAAANTENFKVALGDGLLPFATLAIREFNEMGDSTLKAAESFSEYVRSAEGIERISSALGSIAGVAAAIKTSALPTIEAFGDAFNLVKDELGRLIDGLGETSDNYFLLAGAGQLVSSVIQLQIALMRPLVGIIVDLIIATKDAVIVMSDFFQVLAGKKTFKEVKESMANVGKDVVKLKNNLKKNVVTSAGDIKDLTESFLDDLSNLQDNIIDSAAKASAEMTAKAAEALKKEQQEIKKATNEIKGQSEAVNELNANWAELTRGEKFEQVNSYLATVSSNITSLLSNISSISKQNSEQRIEQIDLEKQAALESAGLAELTTQQQLEADILAAKKENNLELAEEKKKELEKQKIVDQFEAEKLKVQQEAEYRAWEFQVAQARIQAIMAPLNAFASTLAWAQFPGGRALAIANAGLAAAAAGAYLSQVKDAEPKFADGGIVPGSSFAGDNINARVNSGEMILNQDQQARLFDFANGFGGGGNVKIYLGSDLIYDNLYKASKNGELIIDSRGIVGR